jgi:hypothetical protein
VQLYHRVTSKIFNCTITTSEIKDWVTDHFTDTSAKDELRQHDSPSILKKENKQDLYNFLLSGLVVDTRKGHFKVMFKVHLVKSRKMNAITKIQSIFRRANTRPIVMARLDKLMLKVTILFSSSSFLFHCYF